MHVDNGMILSDFIDHALELADHLIPILLQAHLEKCVTVFGTRCALT
jgi:hypothetical protein